MLLRWIRSFEAAVSRAFPHLPLAWYREFSRSYRSHRLKSFSASSTIPRWTATAATRASISLREAASRTARAPRVWPMFPRQCSATSRRLVLMHSQTEELLICLMDLQASSMLPIERWKLKSRSALRFASSITSIVLKFCITVFMNGPFSECGRYDAGPSGGCGSPCLRWK